MVPRSAGRRTAGRAVLHMLLGPLASARGGEPTGSRPSSPAPRRRDGTTGEAAERPLPCRASRCPQGDISPYMADPGIAGSPGRAHWVLIALLVLATACGYSWRANHHLPYLQYSNEPASIIMPALMLRRGLEPPSLQRPTLPLYMLAAVDWTLDRVGRAVGFYGPHDGVRPPQLVDLGIGYAAESPELVVANRIACASMAAGSVLLVFLLVFELFKDAWMALLAALFLSISTELAQSAVIVRPEIFLLFFSILALLGAARVYRRGRPADYVLAGLAAGLAVSSKYNAGMILVALVAAHLLAPRARSAHKWLVVAVVASAVAFFATTPYALIEPQRFLADVTYELSHYETGHLGRDASAWHYYLVCLAQSEGVVAGLALIGAIAAVVTRSRPVLMLLAFGVPYLTFISSLMVRMDRHLVPVLAIVHVCAAFAAMAPLRWAADAHRAKRSGPSRAGALAVFLATALVGLLGVHRTAGWVAEFTGENGRDRAREWIAANVPRDSRIATESRAPWVDRDRFHVRRIPVSFSTSALWWKSPEWYAEQGFDYLILSSQVEGLYRQAAHRYDEQVRRYEALRRSFETAGVFRGGQWAIVVLRVPDDLKPAVRPLPPPWYLWAGPKDPAPLRPDEPWPVVVWEGPEAPLLSSLGAVSDAGQGVDDWVRAGWATGRFIPILEYERLERAPGDRPSWPQD